MTLRVRSFKMPDELYNELKKAAEEDGYRSLSRYVREILERYLEIRKEWVEVERKK
jgi:predicted DNA-binding protein